MPTGKSRAAVPACPRCRSALPPPDFAATSNPRALWQRATQEEESHLPKAIDLKVLIPLPLDDFFMSQNVLKD